MDYKYLYNLLTKRLTELSKSQRELNKTSSSIVIQSQIALLDVIDKWVQRTEELENKMMQEMAEYYEKDPELN